MLEIEVGTTLRCKITTRLQPPKGVLALMLTMLVVMFLVSVIMSYILHRRYVMGFELKDIADSTDNSIGFYPEKKPYKPNPTIDSYAVMIINKLVHTRADDSAFAIGIESDWGTGKTSFLDLLKEKIPADSITMDFNPWISLSEKSLIKEFFDRLAGIVADKINPTIYPPLQEYSNAILAIDGGGSIVGTFQNILSRYVKTDIKTLKDRIKSSLRNSGKKIYIFIDDIDRLESNEIFEVLRLVRNTADFPNLVYIVAYDRDYIVAQLESKGISLADKYLEKIFNLEISLPKTEVHILQRELCDRLIDSIPGTNINPANFPLDLTQDCLCSYRDVERFARQFAVNYMFMAQNVGSDEFDSSDFFSDFVIASP